MLPLRVCLPVALVALVAAGCGSSSGSGSKPVPVGAAAIVGGQIVPKTRVDNLLAQAKVLFKTQHQPVPKPGTSQYRILLMRATGYLVVGAMYLDQAKKEGIVVTDADVRKALAGERSTKYGGSAKKQQAAWKAQGLSPAEAFEQERLALAEQKIQARLVKGVHVTDADVEAFYNQHLQDYTTAASRSVRQIVVDSKSLAQSLEQKLASGANFASLAKQYSKDVSSATNGGAVTIQQGQADPAVDKVAFALKIGQVSDPIESADGSFWIIQAIDGVQPAHQTPLSEIAVGLKRQLLDQKTQQVLAGWQLKVKKAYCGKQIEYAKGYAPNSEFDPCGLNRPVPAAA